MSVPDSILTNPCVNVAELGAVGESLNILYATDILAERVPCFSDNFSNKFRYSLFFSKGNGFSKPSTGVKPPRVAIFNAPEIKLPTPDTQLYPVEATPSKEGLAPK